MLKQFAIIGCVCTCCGVTQAQNGVRLGKTIDSGRITQTLQSGRISGASNILKETKLSDIVVLGEIRNENVKQRRSERVKARRMTTERLHRKKKKNNL